jgi:hypothetical protein
MLCICSPAGQEEFFVEIGVPVATRTTAPPEMSAAAQSEFKAKPLYWLPSIERNCCHTPEGTVSGA